MHKNEAKMFILFIKKTLYSKLISRFPIYSISAS